MGFFNKKITAFCFFAFFVINAELLFSKEDPLNQENLQLETLIEEVLKRNPDLEAARERIHAAAEVVPRVQVLDDPEVEIMSDFNNFKPKSQFIPMMEYRISQTLPFPGKLGLKGKIASEVLKQLQNAKITTSKDLIVHIKRLYFKLGFNQSSLFINETNREIAKNIIEDSLALYRSGVKGYEEVIKSQIELQVLDEELLTIESDRIFIVSMINAALNRPQSAPIGKARKIVNSSENLSFKRLEMNAMQQRSELKGLKTMVTEQEMIAKLAKREYFPDVTFSAGYEQMTGNLSDNAWEASISFKIPIWIGQRQKRMFREAKAKALANSNALQGMKARIQGQIQDLLGKLSAVEEKLLLYQTGLLPKIAEALKSAEISYRTGKGDFLLLLDTRRQYQNIELTFEGFKTEREILLAELERAIGMPLEEIQ